MGPKFGLKPETRMVLGKTLTALEEMRALKRSYTTQEQKAEAEVRMLELRLRETKQELSNMIRNGKTISQTILQMEGTINDLRSTLSPIDALPSEILSQIFAELCKDEIASNQKPSPLILSGVCSRWRSLVIAESSLWKHVGIEAGHMDSNESTSYAQLIQLFMERGRRSQQTLTIDDWSNSSDSYVKTLLTSEDSPWSALSISLDELVEDGVDLGPLRATSVTLDLGPEIDISNFSPLLRHAKKISTNELPHWGSLPWINLQILELLIPNPGYSYEDSRDALISIFHSAPYLLQLTLDFEVSETPEPPAEPLSITHSKLETIRAPLAHFTGNGILFGAQLDVPALKSVVLLSLERWDEGEQDTFYRLWTTPSLLNFFIYGDDVLEAAELVRWYPNVDTLIIEHGETESFFVFMYTLMDQYETSPSTGPLPLPSLTTLRIQDTDLRGETLLAFINARIRHVQKKTPGIRALTSVEMYETPGVTPEEWKLVLEKLEDGRLLNSQIVQ